MIGKVASFILLALVAVEAARKECAGKQGKDTVYCVCNATYCDDIPALTKQDKGSALMFETSKSGSRFKESDLKFSPTAVTDNHFVLTVDKKSRIQKMLGLGAAFTDAAVQNMDALPKDMGKQVLTDYFGNTGIEFSIGRITIASSDFSERWYSYDDDDHDDYDLKDWKLQDEDTKHKIPNIKLAQQVAAHKIKLFGSPWVTPKWLNNKTDLKTNPDKHYHTWADYMIKFLNAYKEAGIDIWGMTMQNEPMSFDNMLFTEATVERDFVVKHLGPALEKAGYTKDKFNLMLFDEGHPKSQPVDYVDTCLKDPDSKKYVTGIAYHCYIGDINWINTVKKSHPDQFVLMSECCQNFRLNTDPPTPSTLGEWNQARDYINGVMHAIQSGAQGWVEWNLALDTFGHPNRDKKAADAPLLIDAAKKEYYKNPNFYALGQYSKFIVPDSYQVKVTSSKTDNNFQFAAFERPDNSVAVIVFNLGNKAIDLVIDDPDHGKITSKIDADAIQSYIYWS